MTRPDALPLHRLPVLRERDVCVVEGANRGDVLSCAADMMLDDLYCVMPDATACDLYLHAVAAGAYVVAQDSPVGKAGAPVIVDAALTFMSPDGSTTEALVLVETVDDAMIAAVYLLPFTEMTPRVPHALVEVDGAAGHTHLAQMACARFSAGTRITMATGEQRPVESLRVGDAVLTRDEGARPICWIGTSTVRAVGNHAPVCIPAGVLNNTNDLLVSPEHRLFIYQRRDHIGAGRAELLVKARHLVDDRTVTIQDGGYVDYYQLLFDSHQIIFAEGIAAESMMIDPRSEASVPPPVSERLRETGQKETLAGLDVHQSLLSRPNIAELLRRASQAG